MNVADGFRRQTARGRRRSPAGAEPGQGRPCRMDPNTAGIRDGGRGGAAPAPFLTPLLPVSEHRHAGICLDPTLVKQATIEQVQHRHRHVAKLPPTKRRQDVGPQIIGVVLLGRRFERITHGHKPFVEELRNGATGRVDPSAGAMSLPGFQCRGPGQVLRRVSAPVLTPTFTAHLVDLDVDPVRPCVAAPIHRHAPRRCSTSWHQAAPSSIAIRRAVTTYILPPNRRVGSSPAAAYR